MSTTPEFVAKAKRIVEAAEERGVVLRLLGGVSFLLRCPSAGHRTLQRDYLDIDFAGYSKQSRGISRVFEGMGYVPREMFNAMQGERRLIFNDLANRRRADVFLDVFEMCHKIDLRKRLQLDKYTIPLADMLATKLQIVQVNEKDIKDVVALLSDFEVGDSDAGMINAGYVARLCSNDWGIYKTFTTNLDRLQAAVVGMDLDQGQKGTVKAGARKLQDAIESAPKSLGWTLRSMVGERVRWYLLPDADVQVVDSRIAKEGEQRAA